MWFLSPFPVYNFCLEKRSKPATFEAKSRKACYAAKRNWLLALIGPACGKTEPDSSTHEEVTLENGMQVLLLPHTGSGLIASNVFVGAGSTREEDRYAGSSHFLEHVLWADPADRTKVAETIREVLRGYEDEVQVLLYQTRELRDYALRPWDNPELRSRAVVEAHTKIRNILQRIDEITAEARTLRRPLAKVEEIRAEVTAIQQEMLAHL